MRDLGFEVNVVYFSDCLEVEAEVDMDGREVSSVND